MSSVAFERKVELWAWHSPSAAVSRNSRVWWSLQQVGSVPRPTRPPSVRWSSAGSESPPLPDIMHIAHFHLK